MKRIDEIREQVEHHRDLYYNATPEISDDEFDELVSELSRLEHGDHG